MTMARTLVPPFVMALVVCGLLAGRASAQPVRPVLGALLGTVTTDSDAVDGTQSSAGAFVVVPVSVWLGVEVELAGIGGTLRREFTGSLISFAPAGSPRDVIDALAVTSRVITERQADWLLSGGVRIVPWRSTGRLRPHLFAGVTNIRAREVERYEHLAIPAGYTLADVERTLPQQPPRVRHLGGLTAGAGLALRLTARLSVAPELRYDYGSLGDEINNTLRTSVRVQWQF
jgi:hypothetical protein